MTDKGIKVHVHGKEDVLRPGDILEMDLETFRFRFIRPSLIEVPMFFKINSSDEEQQWCPSPSPDAVALATHLADFGHHVSGARIDKRWPGPTLRMVFY